MLRTVRRVLREHFNYRWQLLGLARVDLIKTYRGAALGWLWAIIKPLITIVIYWFAFTVGFRAGRPINGYPYWLWLVAGITPWFYMSSMLTSGAGSMKTYSYLITKMRFPVSTIPTFVSLSNLMEHVMILGIVIGIYAASGHGIDIYFLQLPIYLLLMFLLFTVWALFASPLTVINKDFFNLIRSFVTPVFWLSGIMWDANAIDNNWVKLMLKINPFTFICEGYRDVFVYKKWFWETGHALIYFTCIVVIMAWLALGTYRRLARDLADFL